MTDLGQTLAYSLGGNYINRFKMFGQSYKVIPQVSRMFRLNPNDLNQIYINTASGQLVPFQQLNSAVIDAVLISGRMIGKALAFLEKTAKKLYPTE